ncbi:response regulator transcription factor [Candidatus Margulisiibacteriota bacterium]
MQKTIVAVDDEECIRRLIKLALEAEGFNCHIAADGEEGLSKIKEIRPDMVLLDVMMNKLNGYEVVEAMRDDGDLKDIAVVILSARDKDLGLLDSQKELPPVDEYLSKPFDLNELVATVKKYLD